MSDPLPGGPAHGLGRPQRGESSGDSSLGHVVCPRVFKKHRHPGAGKGCPGVAVPGPGQERPKQKACAIMFSKQEVAG